MRTRFRIPGFRSVTAMPVLNPACEGVSELSRDFETLDQWRRFWGDHEFLLRPELLADIACHLVGCGWVEPLTNAKVDPQEIEASHSWREGLLYRGVGSRARAVLQVVASVLGEDPRESPAIYATEAITPFALRLRGVFPRFLGSEFSLNSQIRDSLYPIPCEDLQKLTLRSEAFDIVSTNEVLEHVPSIDRALSEIHRVLRRGGWHVGTIPFHFTRETGVRRAALDDNGEIVHLLEPEYHGDPMGTGALVFEIAGWDIVARARAVGFSRAFMRFILSSRYGILSEHVGGIFVFCCQK